MKQERRHELQTNDLSIMLGQAREAYKKYSTPILGGILVVVLILVVGNLNSSSKAEAEQAAWIQYREIMSADPVAKPETLEKSDAFMQQYMDDANIGPSAIMLHTEMLLRSAMELTDDADKATRIEQLKEASKACSTLISKFSQHKIAANAAQMKLAAIEEALVLEGEGDVEKARKIYQAQIDTDSTYKALSEQRLASLDTRLQPLTIIDPAPETQPAAPVPSLGDIPELELKLDPAAAAKDETPAAK